MIQEDADKYMSAFIDSSCPKSWQEQINEKALLVCSDPGDRELVDVQTYSWRENDQNVGMNKVNSGSHVTAESFRILAERFLVACELIQVMEQNIAVEDSYRENRDYNSLEQK